MTCTQPPGLEPPSFTHDTLYPQTTLSLLPSLRLLLLLKPLSQSNAQHTSWHIEVLHKNLMKERQSLSKLRSNNRTFEKSSDGPRKVRKSMPSDRPLTFQWNATLWGSTFPTCVYSLECRSRFYHLYQGWVWGVGLNWEQANGQIQLYLFLAIILSTSCPSVLASSGPALCLAYILKHPSFYPMFGQCSPLSSMSSQTVILRI